MTPASTDKLCGSIIEFYEKLFTWENNAAKNSGLSPQQNHTIVMVGNDGPIRMKILAEKLGVTMGTLTVMINRLEKSGYVYREKASEDGRGFNILLSDTGRKVHVEHHTHHTELARKIMIDLSQTETVDFIKTLSKINRAI